MSDARAWVLVLSEDSGKDGADVVWELAQHALRLAWPGPTGSRLARVPADAATTALAAGNGWRAPRQRQEVVTFLQTLSTHLAGRGGKGWILLHVDGDTTWRSRRRSRAAEDVDRRLRTPLRHLLATAVEDPEAALGRLVVVVPHYSVEAWTWQNLDRLERIAKKRRWKSLASAIAEWRTDRGALDEIQRIKGTQPVSSAANLELVGPGPSPWPAVEVRDVGKSFAAFVDDLRSNPQFAALASD